MRICSPQLGLSPRSILGGEIYDRQILKYLAKMGTDIEICLPVYKPHEKVSGWHIQRIPVPFVAPPYLYNFLILPYLYSIYRKKPFDILRLASPAFMGLAGILFKNTHPNVKLVSVHHWLGEGGKVEDFILPKLLEKCDAIICDSLFTKIQIKKKFPKTNGRVHVIHNGVDELLIPHRKSPEFLARFRIPPNSLTCLYMGLFIERKNPIFLLKLISKIKASHPNIQLLLCGKGPLIGKIKSVINSLDLEKIVHIVPPVFGSEKKDLMNSADIFLHPALNEGFSLAVIEAMVMGLPVLITDDFSAKEAITNGLNGFRCKSESEWLHCFRILITDKKLRKKMRLANLKKVKNKFQWDMAAKKHELLFQSLISNSHIEK